MKPVKSREVDVAAVQHIKRSGLRRDLIEHLRIGDFCVGNPDKHGYSHAQVEHRVRLDARLAPSELCPGEQLQAQVDGRGIDRERAQLQPQEIGIDRQFDPRRLDHRKRGVHVNAIIALLVGLAQSALGRRGADAAVIAAWSQGAQTTDGLAQTGSAGELGEDHAQQLIHAGEPANTPLAAITIHRQIEGASRKQIQKLSKDGASRIHGHIFAATTAQHAQNGRMKMKSCTLTCNRFEPPVKHQMR